MRHSVGVVWVLVLAVTCGGCQVRHLSSFGDEVAKPHPSVPAQRAKSAMPYFVQTPKPTATTPIKTEDSIIFPQPRADQSAPQALQPVLAVRSKAGATTERADHDFVSLPMPKADDPKVDLALRGLLRRANGAMRRGNLKRSGALYAQATERAPFNPYALHGLAVTDARQGQFAKARSLAARSQFLNATDSELGQANARLLEELDAALASRATGRPTRRR